MRKFSGLVALISAVTVACGVAGTPIGLIPTNSATVLTSSDGPSGTPSPAVSANPPSPSSISKVDATEFPNPAGFRWTRAASGLLSPVDIQFANEATGRMFVVEQVGHIRIVEKGTVRQLPFLDISDRVNSSGNEQGLLGLAFHPLFHDNGRFFVNYTDTAMHNVIASFRASADLGQADADSEVVLIRVDDPFPNHNGGSLAFGSDGYLYAGLGDGGAANDLLGSGQNTTTLLGKILRLHVDRGSTYSVPADNPFAQSGGSPEIWAYGLRNPWKISFDSATGDLYIGDVGQDTWEEIDFLRAGSQGGANFGWNYREGLHAFAGNPPASLEFVHPVAEYLHDKGRCSVSGGFVYRGRMPEWQGIYLYGDYCSGHIWGLLHGPQPGTSPTWRSELLFETGAKITTFGQDPEGELYFADRSGTIYRLGRASPATP